MTPHHSDKILRSAVDDFIYLVDQASVFCLWDRRIWAQFPTHVRSNPALNVVENAVVESTLLSIRVLNDFFSPGRKFKTDIQSHDFGFKSAAFLSQREVKMLNKLLAHFSAERVVRKGDQWKIAIIRKALKKCLRFLEFLKRNSKRFVRPKIRIEPSIIVCQMFTRQIEESIAAADQN